MSTWMLVLLVIVGLVLLWLGILFSCIGWYIYRNGIIVSPNCIK